MINKADIKHKLGKTIARIRTEKQLTQEAVAERLGIGNEALSRIERGIVEPSITRIFELANILDCSVAELLGEASPILQDHLIELAQGLSTLNVQEQVFVLRTSSDLIQQLQSYSKK